MKILAIETSCDETAIAILGCEGTIKMPVFKLLSNVVSSQIKIHAKWGGVVPNLAKREHIKNLPLVFKKVLKEAGLINPKREAQNPKQILDSKSKILNSAIKSVDLIAVTTGPGLEPALWTGINFAQELYKKLKSQNSNLKLIGVNHMEGHIVASLLATKPSAISRQSSALKAGSRKPKTHIKFPALALLVSGGHTEIILINGWLKYKIIGETLDDAAGEAFDKIAKMLKLPYPGGPVVAKLASEHIPDPLLLKQFPKIIFPRPMMHSKNYDFSFSGLKTAVLYFVRELSAIGFQPSAKAKGKSFAFGDFPSKSSGKNQKLFSAANSAVTKAICYEAQQAIIDTLVSKTARAAKEYGVKSVILGGGVAANEELRKQLDKKIKTELPKVKYILPEISLTGDNAAMIGAAAYLRALNKEFIAPDDLKAEGNLALN